MPATNYYEINTYVPSGHKIIGYNVDTWSTNSQGFSVISYANTRAFIVANSGTVINNIQVTFFYI